MKLRTLKRTQHLHLCLLHGPQLLEHLGSHHAEVRARRLRGHFEERGTSCRPEPRLPHQGSGINRGATRCLQWNWGMFPSTEVSWFCSFGTVLRSLPVVNFVARTAQMSPRAAVCHWRLHPTHELKHSAAAAAAHELNHSSKQDEQHGKPT